MSVIQKPLTSASGFRSPGFNVDLNGNLTANSINSIGSLLIGGQPFIQGSSLASTITGSSLTSVGRLVSLNVASDLATNSILTVTNAGVRTSAITLLELNGGLLKIDPVNSPNQVNIGPVGATAVKLAVSGVITIGATTQSTSTVTGALLVPGGVGVVKNINVGGDANITGDVIIGGQNIKALAAALAVALS
jgi:hypothetical protein